jgi:serine/threonine protein kinase
VPEPQFDVDIKRIAHGEFGCVYSARHKTTGQVVAIKELFPDPHQQELYIREVKMLGTLRHPCILRLYGCTPVDENPTIVTPLMAASVQTYIDAERQALAPAFWTATQKHIVLLGIASGMSFMHDQRCIHRDLKPANILLDEACEPYIADFGFSRFVERGKSLAQATMRGTPYYMAPEILSDDAYNFKVDVYSFGIMMFVIMTALDPYPNLQNQLALARQVMNGKRPTIPPDVSRAYADLMEKCWATEIELRPSFKEIVSVLGDERFLEGLDIDSIKAYQARVIPSELIPPDVRLFH